MRALRAAAFLGLLLIGTATAWADGVTAVAVNGPATHASLSAAALAGLPATTVTVSFKTMKATVHGVFSGPSLWAILVKTGAVDAAKPRGQVGQAVLVTGSDGYTAVFGMGEIGPDFEGKAVILAPQFHLIVPGDQRGGRSVKDVVRIDVLTLKPPKT